MTDASVATVRPAARPSGCRLPSILFALALTFAAVAAALTIGATASVGAAPGRADLGGSGAFPARPTRVLVLGDSVMEGAAGAISAALPGREVVVDTEVSRSTAATAAAAAGHGPDWDVVVILVAHNDGGSPAVYQPPYRRMLDGFAAVPRIVVLTIHEVRPYYAAVNGFLRAEAASRRNVWVADWNAVAGANPGSTAGDGLHLSSGGAALMAGLIADRVGLAEAEAAPPPTTTTAPAPTTTSTSTTTTTSTTSTTSTTTTAPSTTTSSTTTRPPPPTALVASRSVPGPHAADGGQPAPLPTWFILGLAMALGTVLLRTIGRSLPV